MMKNEALPPMWQRAPVWWSLLGIAASYPLFWLWKIDDLLLSHWEFFRWTDLLGVFFVWGSWLDPFAGPYLLAVYGVFITFCFWWRKKRHPFVGVLVLLSSLSCTAFSMNGINHLAVKGQVGGMDYRLAAFAVAVHILLVSLCLKWRRTQDTELRVWLVTALVACSPFGMGGVRFFLG